MQPQEPIDYSQPVAYDINGQPLYAHPPAPQSVPPQYQPSPQQAPQQPQPQHQPVYIARAVEPVEIPMSPEAIERHDESALKYPTLNLSREEYVINEVSRHWIGLVGPVSLAGLLVILVVGLLIAYPILMPRGDPPFESFLLPAFLVLLLIGIGTYIIVWVYQNNKFYLTNESVVQEIQTSLFAHNEQTVSLSNIEDASYTQNGIIQQTFNYGSIRLSTEGDETTYRFHYVADPKTQIAILNNAVEAFKNGRPVNGD